MQYGPLPAEQGDLFFPPGVGRQGRPAILVIHGGGWIVGSRSTNAGLSRFLAAQGFVVFNIDYRLAVPADPATHWPAQLEDCQRAVRWLKQHAAELQIDPARIAAVGDSAGGTLAALLGVLRPAGPGAAPGRPEVAAVVDQFGVVDLAALGDRARAIKEGLFGTAMPPSAELGSVSPLPGVSDASAPMLIVHGDRDEFVPIDQSRALQKALAGRGVVAQLVVFAGGHGFAGLTGDAIAGLFEQEAAWLKRRLGP